MRLPPFPALVAFEAVARLGSFTRAAAELGLTQSAVSHRIGRLERHVGARLIERLNPGIALTAAGVAILPDLRRALDLLAALDRGAAAPARRPALRIGVGSALATWWLARRLGRFVAERPAIPIELVPFENADEAARSDVDLRILWVGAGAARRTVTQRPLFREWVFPVCHPSLLPGGRPLRTAADLSSLPLIHKGPDEAPRGRRADQEGAEWRWRTWLGRATAPPALRFREVGAALAAAAEGGGVALGRTLLVHDAIVDGRLAPALPPTERMRSAKVHVARWPRAASDDRRVRAFVDWLAGEASATIADRVGPTPALRESSLAMRRKYH
ncbi:MAG: LysR substrate-binding domain-containing protein [Alphaproteobacteria bacterium]